MGIFDWNTILESTPSTFFKNLAKNTNKKIADWETILKHFEKYENYVKNIDYKVYKQQLDAIDEEKAKCVEVDAN